MIPTKKVPNKNVHCVSVRARKGYKSSIKSRKKWGLRGVVCLFEDDVAQNREYMRGP